MTWKRVIPIEPDIQSIIAAALANARGMRNGVPPIANVLDFVPDNVHEQVVRDAELVLGELKAAGFVVVRAAEEKGETDGVERSTAKGI